MVGKLLYLFRRLREPSSQAAIAGLLGLFGQSIPPGTINTVVNGLAVVFGCVAVFVKEGRPESVVEGF